MFDQNALHRDAGLSGITKTAGDAAFDSVRKIGIAVNDDSGVASKFENDFLFARVVLDRPADGGAAGKADELDSFVGDEQAGIFVREQQGIEAAIGPSCLLDHFSEQQRGERRFGRGFEHHGTSGGDRWRNFVRDQVQGEIKRRDAGDGPKRKTFDDAPAPGGRLLPIERQVFAIVANRFFGGDVEGENGAINFGAGALDGLARFESDGVGKLFFAIMDAGRDLAQNSLAFEGG